MSLTFEPSFAQLFLKSRINCASIGPLSLAIDLACNHPENPKSDSELVVFASQLNQLAVYCSCWLTMTFEFW